MGQNWTQNQVFCYFFKLGSLVFLDIAYNDSLEQCLTCSRGKTHKKYFLDQRGQNWSLNQVFCHFLKFCLLIFLETACSDSLQQCITCSRDKIHENIFWVQILSKGAKIGPETRFYHFLNFDSLVFLEITYNDSLQQCLTCSRGKIYEKNFGAQLWA